MTNLAVKISQEDSEQWLKMASTIRIHCKGRVRLWQIAASFLNRL